LLHLGVNPLPGGALTTLPINFAPNFFLRPGGAHAPSAAPGYAYDLNGT